MGLFDFFRKKKNNDNIPVICARKSTYQSYSTNNINKVENVCKKNEFDNLYVNEFLGCKPGVSTENQIRVILSNNNISFKEHSSSGNKTEKDYIFSFLLSNTNWHCDFMIKEDTLRLITLSYYNPECYKTYRKICEELSERYKGTHDISFYENNSDKTEKMVISDREDSFKFTEIEYDSSPILGQNNIYIRYFN